MFDSLLGDIHIYHTKLVMFQSTFSIKHPFLC